MTLNEIVKQFNINDNINDISPYGEGHINDTYLVTCDSNQYILQRINTKVFPNYYGLMDNIQQVTKFIHSSKNSENSVCLKFYQSSQGDLTFKDESGCYRLCDFIKDSYVYQTVEDASVLEEAGKCIGLFISQLDSFDASSLCEVIENFHHTAIRFDTFNKSLKQNKANRKNNVEKEIEFVLNRKQFACEIVSKIDSKELPLRVTHNDTKLNNILFSNTTKKALCLIDLDTIMPGSLLYDFGDAVRFACSTAPEDEKDLDKVHFDISLYESFTKGFVEGIGKNITPLELEMLNVGAKMMTFECGMRFLTDYLDGDEYFKVKYAEHNLVRARTQFKLVYEMEQKEQQMRDIAYKYYSNGGVQ